MLLPLILTCLSPGGGFVLFYPTMAVRRSLLRRFVLHFPLCAGCALLSVVASAQGAADPGTDEVLERAFQSKVRPFLQTYCLDCHGAEDPKADYDLSPFTSLVAVIDGPLHWEMALDMIESEEMPSSKAKRHPSPEARAEVVAWIHAMRANEAQKNFGDPGLVLARRLSSAEYDYTIHDLTGADIRPTKEFPVDPANQAGFDNSGESLMMSPALLTKYLQAARTVAEHLILNPTSPTGR